MLTCEKGEECVWGEFRVCVREMTGKRQTLESFCGLFCGSVFGF